VASTGACLTSRNHEPRAIVFNDQPAQFCILGPRLELHQQSVPRGPSASRYGLTHIGGGHQLAVRLCLVRRHPVASGRYVIAVRRNSRRRWRLQGWRRDL
jgi:hypothetical protein